MYNADDHVSVFLPMLEWTDRDVVEFIGREGIKCHPLYYDEQGRFHVERRLGCMGCPLPNHHGKPDFKAHPQLLRAWLRAGAVWMQKETLKSADKFQRDPSHLLFHNLFCESYDEYLEYITPDMFGQCIDPRQFLSDYFGINLDNIAP
jgi:3'-phosphoadenosine 5'-phosphosulfate sulfotransferase (PAPS reductase)/FAD synthetase